MRSSTLQEQMEESSIINQEIRKEMLPMKFVSEEVDGQTFSFTLNFCQFIEGIDFSENPKFVCIDVVRSIECIFR
jgi:hypothetical protein